MVKIRFDEAVLLLRDGVVVLDATGIRGRGVMVVVGPLGEVVGELEPRQIGRGIFKVDDNELLVLVLGLQKGRTLVIRADAQNVAVLCLCEGVR